MVKRETGVNPVRTRHCDKGAPIRILVTDADKMRSVLGRRNLCDDLSVRKPASCLVSGNRTPVSYTHLDVYKRQR